MAEEARSLSLTLALSMLSLAGVLALALSFLFLLTPGKSSTSFDRAISSWITQCDPATNGALSVLEPQTINASISGSYFSANVSIDSTVRYQQIMGYGAGLPQASAYVLANLKAKNNTAYTMVLNKLFSRDAASMSILRFPLASCDFSMTSTSFDEVDDDYDLSEFAIDADSDYIIEVLKDVKKIRPDLKLMAAPWSPPSWLKVNDSLIAYSNNNTVSARIPSVCCILMQCMISC